MFLVRADPFNTVVGRPGVAGVVAVAAVALELGHAPLGIAVASNIGAAPFAGCSVAELGCRGGYVHEREIVGGPVAETVTTVAYAAAIRAVAAGTCHPQVDHVFGVAAAVVREHAPIRSAIVSSCTMAVVAGRSSKGSDTVSGFIAWPLVAT